MNELHILRENWRLYLFMFLNALSVLVLLLVPFYFTTIIKYVACNSEGIVVNRVRRILSYQHYYKLRNENTGMYIVCFGFQFKLFSFSSYIDGSIYRDVKSKILYSNAEYFRELKAITYDRLF